MPVELRRKLITICAITLCTSSRLLAQSSTTLTEPPLPQIIKVIPAFNGFYSKLIYCYGIPIRAAKVVDDKALIAACQKMRLMLRYLPDVRQRLVHNGAELHIIGKDQQTSDLPEFTEYKGKKYWSGGVRTTIDDRTRGMGGLYASCGEENLLDLPCDRYWGNAGIMVHEFAHTIMNNGMDKLLRNKIKKQYYNALRKGLWQDTYAATNAMEYWAELSSWYFGSHGDFLRDSRLPEPGPDGLRKYDPEGYALCNDIYNKGQLQALKPLVRIPAAIVTKNVWSVGPDKSMAKHAGITFTNNTAQKVFVDWIDLKGKPQAYATLNPHSRYTQLTFINHVWMLSNADKKPIGYYQVTSPDCEVVVTIR